MRMVLWKKKSIFRSVFTRRASEENSNDEGLDGVILDWNIEINKKKLRNVLKNKKLRYQLTKLMIFSQKSY